MKRFILFLLFLFAIAINPSVAQKHLKTMCTPPVVTMSANVTICAGQSATLNATGSGTSAPYTYAWTPVGTLNNPNLSNPVATPAGTQTYTCLVTDGVSCTETGTVTVTVNALPGVGMTGAGSICIGNGATLSGTGGSTYSWSTGAVTTSITVSPTTATSYTVWGTNAAGCSNTATGTVNINSPPSISISGAASSICNGTSATLTGTGGSTYSWSTGAVTNPITVSPPSSTTYTVWGTDAVGCSNTATATVNVNALPAVSISGGATSICNGNSATLTGSGGTSYSWSTGAVTTSITVSPTTSTTYTVWGTDANGCSNTATSTVDIFSAAVAGIGGTNPICVGQTTTLTASGGTSFSWWNNGSTSNPLTDNPTSTTTYTVTATDANGCSDDDVFTVTVNPLPTANAGTDVSICSGFNTTLNATGNGTFLWSPSTGLSSTTDANPTANPTVTTSYTVTVTNSCGSIDDSVMVTITTTPSVNAGTDATICMGGNTTLIASGSGTYAWSPGTGLNNTSIANPTANPTASTNYTVTITTGCGTAEDSVWVIIDAPLATVSGNSPVCSGSSSTLCATGGGTYAWSAGPTTSCITVSPTSATNYTVTITDSFGCTDSDTLTINVNALPTAAIAGNSTICFGLNDTLVATGGTGYVWNTGATTDTLIVNLTSATGYTVTVTDGNGCSDTAAISVTVNPLPTANAGTDATICNGSNTTLTGAGTGTYLWNPGGQITISIVVNPTTTTTYTFSVTNSCGTAEDSVVVNVNALPAAAISGNTTICNGSSTTLTASGGGTYVWNPTAQTTTSITVSPTTNTGYTVTVTGANGCTDTASATVNVGSVTASITGTNSTICSGQPTTLTASGGGTYVWNPGGQTSTSISVFPTTNTDYTVTATNALGCTGTATFSVTVTAQPTASITVTGSTTVCAGSSTTLTGSGGAAYSWTPGGQTTPVIVVNPVSPTTYSVIVSNGGCADTTSISIGVNPLPTASVTATSAIICVGGCDSLFAFGGNTYVWSSGQSTSSINVCPTADTTYAVTVTDANGCTASASALINVIPPVNVSVNGITSICAGVSITLTASGGGAYSWWNNGATSATITDSPTTSTTYTVIGSNACSSDTATINVNVSPVPTALATANPYTILIGAQTTLTGTTSTGTYNWNPTTGLNCGTCPNPVANPTATTTYILTTTDANGCTATDTVIVNVRIECEDIFIPSAFSPNADGKNDFVTIRTPCIKSLDFTIYNRWGQVVYHTDDVSIVNKSNDGWDGYFKGKLCDPAVFFYILNVNLITEDFINKNGNVSLVR
ncbi:MAG: gliding motility-associated C-terminal domain-containing protein [Bacteroidetes bacterium]|nr:gliding motility-associated C-terminal domain-containing protein [Bacteroidota bacterium]